LTAHGDHNLRNGRHDAIAPALAGVFASCRDDLEGDVADYIPELAKADPDRFGMALATVDGRLWTQGDADFEFTIQSVSKPLAYCLALELHGHEKVRQHVGVEPSGDAFNAIVFDPQAHRPSTRW
jgi:glutaminase